MIEGLFRNPGLLKAPRTGGCNSVYGKSESLPVLEVEPPASKQGPKRQSFYIICLYLTELEHNQPTGSRYLIIKELGFEDHIYYGFWDLIPQLLGIWTLWATAPVGYHLQTQRHALRDGHGAPVLKRSSSPGASKSPLLRNHT